MHQHVLRFGDGPGLENPHGQVQLKTNKSNIMLQPQYIFLIWLTYVLKTYVLKSTQFILDKHTCFTSNFNPVTAPLKKSSWRCSPSSSSGISVLKSSLSSFLFVGTSIIILSMNSRFLPKTISGVPVSSCNSGLSPALLRLCFSNLITPNASCRG